MTPEDWSSAQLGSVGTWLSGGTPSKQNAAYWDGPIPWVSPKDMKRSRLADAIDHVASDSVGNGTQLAPAGSLLIVVRGMILAHTFPVARAERPLAFNQDVKALVPDAAFESEFLLYWLQSKQRDVLQMVDVANHGTKRLASQRLFAMPVPRPPIAEQTKIAAILSSVDDAIEATQAVIEQLQLVKKAMMAELLTRGLPGQHKSFKMTEIGEVPEEWDVLAIDEVADVAYGLTVNAARRGYSRRVPYLTVANLQEDGFDLKVVKDIGALPGDVEKYGLRISDLLIVEGNANIHRLGRAAVWQGQLEGAMHQNHLIRVRVRDANLDPAWLSWCLNGITGREQIEASAKTSSGLHTINSRVVGELRIPLPRLDERRAICEALAAVDDLLDEEAQVAECGRAVKAALMSVLLTGEVRVKPDEAAE